MTIDAVVKTRQLETVEILDSTGSGLTHAAIAVGAGQKLMGIQRVEKPANLFDYFFNRQGRDITVRTSAGVAQGRLDTRWMAGRRRWLIHLV